MALQLLKDNADRLVGVPPVEVLHGRLLIEAGELEAAAKLLSPLAKYAKENLDNQEIASLDWVTPVAWIELGRGDFRLAKAAWSDKHLTPSCRLRRTNSFPIASTGDCSDASPDIGLSVRRHSPVMASHGPAERSGTTGSRSETGRRNHGS